MTYDTTPGATTPGATTPDPALGPTPDRTTQARPRALAHVISGPPAPVLVGGAFLLSAGVQLVVFGIGMLVASQHDIDAPEGVRASLVSVAVVSAACLAVALAVSLTCHRDTRRAKVGAIALGALAVVTLPFFWSGAPAIFGSNAAWLGGFARGSRPQTGAARGLGIVGFLAAVLNIVAILVLTLGSVATKGYSA